MRTAYVHTYMVDIIYDLWNGFYNEKCDLLKLVATQARLKAHLRDNWKWRSVKWEAIHIMAFANWLLTFQPCQNVIKFMFTLPKLHMHENIFCFFICEMKIGILLGKVEGEPTHQYKQIYTDIYIRILVQVRAVVSTVHRSHILNDYRPNNFGSHNGFCLPSKYLHSKHSYNQNASTLTRFGAILIDIFHLSRCLTKYKSKHFRLSLFAFFLLFIS